jgi:phosphopantothenoylcysteine decarboxylase/phosphopantothenate--cysteine ligase
MLKGKKILIGVTGSIAAYKSAYLVRWLVKNGAEVKVIMTEAASQFIAPITLATLSKNKVCIDLVASNDWNNHVELGLWADLFIIAPASANTIAKMANGLCDNILMACFLSAKCPVWLAPAMDLDMWAHATTQRNIATLVKDGHHIVEVQNGQLASGLVGPGRMEEPEKIGAQVLTLFNKAIFFENKNVLITAGPTHEPIDPVRFIGNNSSGKMGIELAMAAANAGAKVVLVLGPTHLTINNPNVTVLKVTTAQQMFEVVMENFKNTNIAICAAAVADFRIDQVADKKIKKEEQGALSLNLVKNVDILAHLGTIKQESQFLVGFALETNNAVHNATQKLLTKNADAIVLNSLENKGAGFAHDTNQISIISKNNKVVNFELKSKKEVAQDIIQFIYSQLQ